MRCASGDHVGVAVMRPVRCGVVLGAVAVAVGACGHGDDAPWRGGPKTPGVTTAKAAPARVMPIPSGPRPQVSPLRGKKHDGFRVFVVTQHETGVFGKTRRSYHVEAHAVRPASACVNTTERRFPDGKAGETMYATLAPAPGKGGAVGWCRGLFRGTVRYQEAFACPSAGRCRTPAGFPKRSEVVVRFSFRVL
jgi:hypothetical protein